MKKISINWKLFLLGIIPAIPEIYKIAGKMSLANVLWIFELPIGLFSLVINIIIYRLIYDSIKYDDFSLKSDWWSYTKKYFIPYFSFGLLLAIPIVIISMAFFQLTNDTGNFFNTFFEIIEFSLDYFVGFSLFYYIGYKTRYLETLRESFKAIISYQKIIGVIWLLFLAVIIISYWLLNTNHYNLDNNMIFFFKSILKIAEKIFKMIILFWISSDLFYKRKKENSII